MLDFKPVCLDDLNKIYEYTSRYGEGSCQHSPVSMYSLFEKYGDMFCIRENFLYVLRKNLCDDVYRVYMAPFGEMGMPERNAIRDSVLDSNVYIKAYNVILEDAHSYGKKALFMTLTRKHKAFLEDKFCGCFDFTQDRDFSEYIYNVNTMLEFPGKKYARRRTEIRSFWRNFGERTVVRRMAVEDIDEVKDFSLKWYEENCESHDAQALQRELTCIYRQLENFTGMKLSGTVITIDGEIKAFCYGVGLNDSYYDVLIEKGTREYPGIYRVLRQESTKLNAKGYRYINFEEDVGVPGLRKMKESYGPEFMIDKYIVREK